MDKLLGKLLLLMVVLGIGVFYGVGISKHGIEQVHGPIEEQEAAAEDEPSEDEASASSQQGAVIDERGTDLVSKELPPPSSALGRIFDKIASLLGFIADGIIRFFVGIGEAVLS